MSYLLPHLKHGYAVDQAIVHEQERVVVIRFGQDENSTCMVVATTTTTIIVWIKSKITW